MDDIRSLFPKLPTVQAFWTPIYLEPMPGSGDRLTVAVAAKGASGYFILPTLDPKRAYCMYGDRANQVVGMASLIVESLADHLSENDSLAAWPPPFHGTVFLGPTRSGHGDELEDIAFSGAQLTSSLVAASMEKQSDEPLPIDGVGDPNNWEREIRQAVLAIHDDWKGRFGVTFRIAQHAAPTRIGYMGVRLAASFDKLVPTRNLGAMRDRAKSRLVNLQILRDQDRLAPRSFYELMLWKPAGGTPIYSRSQLEAAEEAFTELESFGDRHELRVRAVADTNSVLRRLLEAEAA